MTFARLGLQTRSSSRSEFSIEEMIIQNEEETNSNANDDNEVNPSLNTSHANNKMSFLSISSLSSESENELSNKTMREDQWDEIESISNLNASSNSRASESNLHLTPASRLVSRSQESETSSGDPENSSQGTMDVPLSPLDDNPTLNKQTHLCESATEELNILSSMKKDPKSEVMIVEELPTHKNHTSTGIGNKIINQITKSFQRKKTTRSVKSDTDTKPTGDINTSESFEAKKSIHTMFPFVQRKNTQDDSGRGYPHSLSSLGRKITDLSEQLSLHIESEKSAQSESMHIWSSTRHELMQAHKLIVCLIDPNNKAQSSTSLQHKREALLENLSTVYHKIKKAGLEHEGLYMRHVHHQQLLTQRIQDLRDEVTQLITCKGSLDQPNTNPVSYSPMTKGMQQLQQTEYEDSVADLGITSSARSKQQTQCLSTPTIAAAELHMSRISDRERLEQSIKELKIQEVSLKMEIENTKAKLKTVTDNLETEEEKHKLYSIKNAKMLYSYNTRLDELKGLIDDANRLCSQIDKRKSKAERQVIEALQECSNEKDKLLLEATKELKLMKSTKDELLFDISKAKKKCSAEKTKALEAITQERILTDLELKKKEELLNAHFLEKKSNLAKEISEMREEITTWREFKEGICEQFQNLKHLQQEIQVERTQLEHERTWLFEKQKEVKKAMEQNKKMSVKLKKEVEVNTRMLEACKILKKQIELTILFHKEKGSVHQIVYWDSKRVKAFIPPDHTFPSMQ
eukprot:g612.t1